ncbi:helix-turn-helix domain-containing protein [Consotaella aegiceratis]|uniref:helix-turn-helix domain-containing protein n=1 Tax=Consotaella aegiceratis TaxID=3097961 RepID=UPI002F42736A
MLVLPIPMIVALVLGMFFVRSWIVDKRPWLFSSLLAICALQSVIVSLRQYYGIAQLSWIQPVTATLIPPLAWIAFRSAAVSAIIRRRDLVHLAAPAFTAFCVLFAPMTVDVVVCAIFLGYGAAILWHLRRGSDALAFTRLEAGDQPALIWKAIACALILSAFADALIALALAGGEAWLRPWFISLFSSASLAAVGILSLARDGMGEAPEEIEPKASVARPPDPDLMPRLEQMIRCERLFLDPDLTLARLAKRLRVPAKQLSAAVNQTTGDNVSRYINGFRIHHACERLVAGDSVTAAMLASGFNTKSNFNREFSRVTGTTPSNWTAQASD